MASPSISSSSPVPALAPAPGAARDPSVSPDRVVVPPEATRPGEEDVGLRPGRDQAGSRDDTAPRDGFRLSDDAIERLGREDPALEARIRAEAEAALARARAMAADADTPLDQAAFRAEVIDYLKAIYLSDPAFARALERGTIVVRPAAGDEDPQMQPELTHAVYRSGALRSGAPLPGEGVDRHDFVAWWPH